MSMYGKNHYNIVISLQLIKINEKKQNDTLKFNVFYSILECLSLPSNREGE